MPNIAPARPGIDTRLSIALLHESTNWATPPRKPLKPKEGDVRRRRPPQFRKIRPSFVLEFLMVLVHHLGFLAYVRVELT